MAYPGFNPSSGLPQGRQVGHNPYAPHALNALAASQQGAGHEDLEFDYPFNIVLTPNQSLTGQPTPIDNDALFKWRAVQLTGATGPFLYRLADSSGNFLSSTLINSSALLVGGVAVVCPLGQQIDIPAGGQIKIDLQDISGATNTIQLVYKGIKRYTLPNG